MSSYLPRPAASDERGEGDVTDLTPLWSPLKIAGQTLPNRIMASATTLQYGVDQDISARHLAYYRERAAGGIGLLVSEELSASPLCTSPFASALVAHDPSKIAGFRSIIDELAPYDTRFFAQLFASGAYTGSTMGMDDWGPPRAPSRVSVPGFDTPLPLTTAEIEQIIEDFARSAHNMLEAGIHGVEVHGAHGWLVGQFLSPFFNRRTDQWGGSLENRCNFARRIGEALRAAVGPDMPVGLTLSADEYISTSGITESEALAQLDLFAADGVYDFYDLSTGSPHSENMQIAPMAVPEGFLLPFAAKAKAVVGDRAAVFVAGRVVDVGMAAAAVGTGAADMVAMTRAHIADPHIVRKARVGQSATITPCVGVNVCVARAIAGEPVACAVTPASGREETWSHDLTVNGAPDRTRRVVILGAGPAGLQTAAVAAERGHEVIVLERRAAAGGHLRTLSTLPSLEAWTKTIENLVDRIELAGGEIRLGVDATVAGVAETDPDQLVIATGAEWDATGESTMNPPRGPIPGAAPEVIQDIGAAIDRVAVDPLALGRRVVIVDTSGDAPAVALAEKLGRAGVEVDLITPADALGAVLAVRLELPHALERLAAAGVAIGVRQDVHSIEGDSVLVEDVNGAFRRTLDQVDCLVVSQERRPPEAFVKSLLDAFPDAHVIGDALSPRSIEALVYEAEALARRI